MIGICTRYFIDGEYGDRCLFVDDVYPTVEDAKNKLANNAHFQKILVMQVNFSPLAKTEFVKINKNFYGYQSIMFGKLVESVPTKDLLK